MSPADLAEVVRLHGMWLRGVDGGQRANLADANLGHADLADANLGHADLAGAFLRFANLKGANLTGADLAGAFLRFANLKGANLTGADLASADLASADLTGATMPDGRRWEDYHQDHLAGICSELGVVTRALAAWGQHDWSSCPMHSALGIDGLHEIQDYERRRLVACWVALYDANHLTVDGAVRS